MDQVTRKAVEERARALWQEAGSPEGDTLRYWFRAEVELGVIPEAEAQQGEHRDRPAIVRQADDPLQRSVDAAVPTAERLPRGAEENPLSQQRGTRRRGERATTGGDDLPGWRHGRALASGNEEGRAAARRLFFARVRSSLL